MTKMLDSTGAAPAAGPVARTTAKAGAIVGRRSEQQDAASVTPVALPSGQLAELIVLADGMGGHAGGTEASTLAVEQFISRFKAGSERTTRERLREALEVANTSIRDAVAARPNLRGMGCTLIGAVVTPGAIEWISVGDSLLLLVTAKGVERLNADHSMAPQIDEEVKRGLRSAASAMADPNRHALRSALIGKDISLIDQGERRLDGQMVLVASDGLMTLNDDAIADTLRQAAAADRFVQSLLARIEADMPADQDNTTLVAFAAQGGARSSPAPRTNAGLMAGIGIAALVLALAAILGLVLLPQAKQEATTTPPEGPGQAPTTGNVVSRPPPVSSSTDELLTNGLPRPALTEQAPTASTAPPEATKPKIGPAPAKPEKAQAAPPAKAPPPVSQPAPASPETPPVVVPPPPRPAPSTVPAVEKDNMGKSPPPTQEDSPTPPGD